MYRAVTRAGFVHILPRAPPNYKGKVIQKLKDSKGFWFHSYFSREFYAL
jgi:hypothetical protein